MLLTTWGLAAPVCFQYKVYLFERILLCCKEINPNKPKNRVLGNSRPLTDKKGKLRLQLKGRIFMQNVTDVVSLKNGNIPRLDWNLYTDLLTRIQINSFTPSRSTGKVILVWRTLLFDSQRKR
jgi:hypothetical protein